MTCFLLTFSGGGLTGAAPVIWPDTVQGPMDRAQVLAFLKHAPTPYQACDLSNVRMSRR